MELSGTLGASLRIVGNVLLEKYREFYSISSIYSTRCTIDLRDQPFEKEVYQGPTHEVFPSPVAAMRKVVLVSHGDLV